MSLTAYIAAWLAYFICANAFERRFLDRFQDTLPSQYTNTSNQFANLFHGLAMLILGAWDCLAHYEPLSPLTPFRTEILRFSLAFFIVDTAAILWFRHNRWDMYFHHALSIFLFANILYTGAFSWYGLAFIALGELGFSIYLEQLAKRWKVQKPGFYYANDLCYLILFSSSRVFGLGYLIVTGWPTPSIPLYLKILAVVFYLLGIYWVWKLGLRFQRRYLANPSPPT